MARRQPLGKTGSTEVDRLRVIMREPGTHTGIPDTSDQAYTTLFNGGGFTGPSAANTASALGSTQMNECLLLGPVYVPTSNSTPTINAGAFGVIDFDAGTVAQFPLRPGDLVLVSKMANWAPIAGKGEAYVYADPLDASGLVCIGAKVIGASTGTACRIQAFVVNPTGAAVQVPSTWLPNLNIVRLSPYF